MEWSYLGVFGPKKWCELYPSANGKYQSPIDLQEQTDTNNLIMDMDNSNKSMKIHYFPHDLFYIQNTGSSWKVDAKQALNEISGGPLNANYELLQIHAHWGANDNEGSEHTVNGKQYAGELHLVHWNKTNYLSAEEAMKHPDGLCVLGVFFKLGQDNFELEKIARIIPKIIHKNEDATLPIPINPKNLLPNNLSYWTYMGSLTTPPCTECVVWVVFREPIEISQKQLATFRSLRTHTTNSCNKNYCKDEMILNFRPTQSIGNRKVQQYDS